MAAHAQDPAPEVTPEHEIDTNVLEAGEPQTPAWLPVLGCALFIAAGVFLLATCGAEPDPVSSAAATSAEASAAPVPSGE